MEVIKQVSIAKKILKKMAVENNFDIDNVYVNKQFGYIETINCNKKDADFCETVWRGAKYKVKYLSGCLNPYIVKL